MVKKAEKIVKRSPLLPIYGAVIAVGMGVVSYFLVDQVLLKATTPPLRDLAASIQGLGANYNLGHIAIIFGVWLVLVGIAYFAVALLIGKDPDSPQNIPMPERKVVTRGQNKKK